MGKVSTAQSSPPQQSFGLAGLQPVKVTGEPSVQIHEPSAAMSLMPIQQKWTGGSAELISPQTKACSASEWIEARPP